MKSSKIVRNCHYQVKPQQVLELAIHKELIAFLKGQTLVSLHTLMPVAPLPKG